MITEERKAYIKSVLCSFTDEEIYWYLNEPSPVAPKHVIETNGNATSLKYVYD